MSVNPSNCGLGRSLWLVHLGLVGFSHCEVSSFDSKSSLHTSSSSSSSFSCFLQCSPQQITCPHLCQLLRHHPQLLHLRLKPLFSNCLVSASPSSCTTSTTGLICFVIRYLSHHLHEPQTVSSSQNHSRCDGEVRQTKCSLLLSQTHQLLHFMPAFGFLGDFKCCSVSAHNQESFQEDAVVVSTELCKGWENEG